MRISDWSSDVCSSDLALRMNRLMTTHTIREAVAADRDWLADCAVVMALETEHKRLEPGTVRAGIDAGIADPAKARYFVAADGDGAPVGTLMLTREWSDWRNGDWWWMQSVYVVPAWRRQGVFAALYRHVEELALATRSEEHTSELQALMRNS